MRRVFAFVCLIAFGVVGPLFAQGEQTGSITGRLTSADSLALPGVTVTVTSPALQGSRAVTADVNGVYAVRGLPPGDYDVTYELSGFARAERRVTVALGSPLEVNQVLAPAGVTVTVEVKAMPTSPAVAPAGTFNQQIAKTNLLPIGRTPMQIAELGPGLTDNTPNQNQLTIGGGVAYDNVFLVDGVDVNDNVLGQPNGLFIEEGIQELQTLSSGISAEYGRFAGGVVNVVTRSGGNVLSGAFRVNLSNPSWSVRTPLEVQKGTTRPDKLSPEYEAISGGPIKKDRLWFFGGARIERTTTANLLPQTNIPYEGKNDNQRYEAKLTGTFAANQTLQGTFINSRTDQYTVSHPNAIDPLALTKPVTDNRLGVGTWRGVIAGKAFATAQYSQKFWEVRNNGGTSGDIHQSPFLTRGVTSGVPGNLEYSAPYFDSTDPDARNNRQLTGSISYLLAKRGFGSHNVKAGAEYFVSTRRTGNSQTSTGYIFQTDYKVLNGTPVLDGNGRLIPVFVTGSSRLATWMPTRGAKVDVTTTSAFVTDRWTAGSRLTVDAGLRFENVGTAAADQQQAVRAQALMPRLSAQYALTSDARTVAGASYSVYSGTYNDVQFSRNSAAGNPDRITGTYTGPSGQGLDFAPAFNPANYTTISGTFPTANVFFSPNLKSPVTRELTLSIGRDFGHALWAKGRYVRRRATEFVEDFINTSTGTTTIVRNGINFGTFDNAVYQNTDLDKRQYDAIDMQSGWQPNAALAVAGQWTVQLRNNGNFEGEAANNPAIPSVIGDYPEMYVPSRNFPMGRLDDFQRSKVRVWATWGVDLGPAGRLDLAPLYVYNSAKTFSYTATVPMSPQQIAANPGYARPPTSQTLYFGARGAGTFAGYALVDLAATWQVPVWRTLSPWVKLETLNLLNNQKLVNWDTTVTADMSGPKDANGLPISYVRGPNFGKATSTTSYPRPMPGMDGGRTFIGAFGFRF